LRRKLGGGGGWLDEIHDEFKPRMDDLKDDFKWWLDRLTDDDLKKGRFRLFSGFRGHVKAATVEVDCVHEVLPVPEAPRRVLHPLDLGIDGFAGRVGDPMPHVRDDVLEPPFEHPRYLD